MEPIYRSDGEWVAVYEKGHLFTVDGEWLGFVVGRRVFSTAASTSASERRPAAAAPAAG